MEREVESIMIAIADYESTDLKAMIQDLLTLNSKEQNEVILERIVAGLPLVIE